MRIEIGFGIGFTKTGRVIDPDGVADKLTAVLNNTCGLFGGCTILEGIGAWKNGAGEVVREPSRVLVINVTHEFQVKLGAQLQYRAHLLAEFVRDLFEQEAVAFAILPCTTSIV